MKKLSRATARRMQAARKTFGHGTGRPRKPALCPKCSAPCASVSLARVHCNA